MMYFAMPQIDDRRDEQRLSVDRPAVLRVGASVEEIELLDLTSGGCRFRSRVELPLFARVSIGIGGVGHRIAHIAWKDNANYGCAFEEPLPAEAVTSRPPENVARILTATHLQQLELEGEMTEDEKMPMQFRVMVITGLAAVSWVGLLAMAQPLLAFTH